MSLNELPEDCVSTILSLSSPQDVCRCAAACSELQSVADSDRVWESFLPNDYGEIVSSADLSLLKLGSKKQLFFRLCNSVLIDGGKKAFNLDKVTGLKSYILSARDLSIAWADEPLYWSWKNTPHSRFKESAELITTSWLEIHGYINMRLLSSNTIYGAYLIFKVSKRAYGLDTMPMELSIKVGNESVCHNNVYLRQNKGKKQQIQWLLHYNNRTKVLPPRVNQGSEGSIEVVLGARDDGWTEIELGHFFSGETCNGDERVVKMSLMEIKGHHLKGGLVVEGIEIRPLH